MSRTTVFALLDGQLGADIEGVLNADGEARLLAVDDSTDCFSDIRDEEPDVILSAGYQHIIPEEVLNAAGRAINLHWSYLPYARGANTNVWSIIDDHPAGVSIHEMVPMVDAGPIIARRKVKVNPDDTGRSLYERLLSEQFDLFAECWPDIRSGEYETKPNPIEEGTFHRSCEFDDLCELDLDETATYAEMIDHLRALTFSPYQNAFFERDGQRYFVDIDITPASGAE